MSAVAAPCYHCEVASQPKHALLALAVENERPHSVFLSLTRWTRSGRVPVIRLLKRDMPEIVFGESFDRS